MKDIYFEVGDGASALTISDGRSLFSNDASTIIGFINFGYRYQPEKNGFITLVGEWGKWTVLVPQHLLCQK